MQIDTKTCSVTFMRPEYHRPTEDLNILRVSSYSRRLIHDLSDSFGMTVSRLKLCGCIPVQQRIILTFSFRSSKRCYGT